MTYLRRILTAAGVTAASFGLLVIVGTGPAGAGNASGIAGSTHDFSGAAWNTAKPGEICAVCHAPHDINKAAAVWQDGLLWNREASANDGAYTLYDTTTMNFLDGVMTQPDGTAKLCLGCHDGSTALQDFGGVTGGATFIVAGKQVPSDGINLKGTHPISITYDNVTDTGLNDPATALMNGSLTVASLLDNGKVQCATCHDVHDSSGEAEANTALLRKLNAGAGADASGLCRTCHNK